MRKCGHCRKPASMGNAVQSWCSIECGLAMARKAQDKQAKRKAKESRTVQREAKERVKTTPTLRKEAQQAFNSWIRARDAGLPCVSCGRPDDGKHQRHAGHYRSVGGHPALRFHPDNCHAQCATCNNHLSGNLVPYRAELIKRIGLAAVSALEGPQAPARHTREQLADMKKHFAAQARELLRGNQLNKQP